MQTTSTIQHTPAGVVDLPATVLEISDKLDATTSLSGSSLAVTVFERRQCERKKIIETQIDTSTKSHPSRGWTAVEAASTLVAGLFLAKAVTVPSACNGDDCIGSGLSDALTVSLYSGLFVGGVAATTTDLIRGETTHRREIKARTSREVFDCSQAVGAGIAVSLRSPGTAPLQASTDSSGRVSIDLSEQRLPLELWIDGKPLRMISSLARTP